MCDEGLMSIGGEIALSGKKFFVKQKIQSQKIEM